MKTDAIEAFRAISDYLVDLARGWPDDWDDPTDLEAVQIEATHDELLLHEPGLGEDRAWMIAGNIVARFRRDIPGQA